MEYYLDTNLGCIEVSKSEFEDVKNRHTGVYGKDWTVDDFGQAVIWREDTSIPGEIHGNVIFQSKPNKYKAMYFELLDILKKSIVPNHLKPRLEKHNVLV